MKFEKEENRKGSVALVSDILLIAIVVILLIISIIKEKEVIKTILKAILGQ